MADRPLSIDIRHPLLLKANDLVLLTREDGEIVRDVPGFGLFYRDTCYLAAYALRLHGTSPLLLMSSDREGTSAQIALTNRHLADRQRPGHRRPQAQHPADLAGA